MADRGVPFASPSGFFTSDGLSDGFSPGSESEEGLIRVLSCKEDV